MRCSVMNMPSAGVRGLSGTANLVGRHTTGSVYSVLAATSHSTASTTYSGMGARSLNATVKPVRPRRLMCCCGVLLKAILLQPLQPLLTEQLTPTSLTAHKAWEIYILPS